MELDDLDDEEIPDTPSSPDAVIEDSPSSPPAEECGQGGDQLLTIPLSPTKTVAEEQPSAFQLMSKQIQQEQSAFLTQIKKTTKKNRARINLFINKFMKANPLTSELLKTTVDDVMMSSCIKNPSVFIRHLIACVIKTADDLVDLSFTPPAPPMTVSQQRCLLLLRAIDTRHKELEQAVNPEYNLNLFTGFFLDELSHILFNNLTLTLEEMCSLVRVFIGISRSQGQLGRARVFLYDCLFFFPPRAYALTYTILCVWAEVLRHVNFPTGLTCMDRTVVYLLFNCTKVKAVPGLQGKVLQIRSLIQSTYGYQTPPTTTLDDLTSYLMSKLVETRSMDEATSIAACLKLISRWEGIDWSANLVQVHLWPLLEGWSKGLGEHAGAAAALTCIGYISQDLPCDKLHAVEKMLTVLIHLLNQGPTVMQEAALSSLVILGGKHNPQTVINLLKSWKPNWNLSPSIEAMLKSFVKKCSSRGTVQNSV